ncbi:unnamed protein product, partial [Rotaria sp. Silwood1]
FGATFLTGISSDIFGLKWTIIIGEIAYVLYISANIRPVPILINIWGNLISYLILNQSNNPEKYNCGVYFNPLSKNETDKAPHVRDLTRYVLCGVFVGMGIFSMILLLLLDQIRPTKPQPIAQSLRKGLEVVQSLFRWKNIDQLLLIPLTMWTTIENAFLTAQFTRAFVTCLVGIRYIGLVMICFGICNALCSYIFGDLVKYIGRIGCFIIAAILNYASIIVMYFWKPYEDQMYVLFIIAGVWGVADAVWQSQVVGRILFLCHIDLLIDYSFLLAAYTVLYSKTDSSAIAKYRLWKAVGSLVTYGVNISHIVLYLKANFI